MALTQKQELAAAASTASGVVMALTRTTGVNQVVAGSGNAVVAGSGNHVLAT